MEMTVDALAANTQDGVGHSPIRMTGRPVDLVHLARYTLGNNSIEREVLSLFRTQSNLFLQRLKEAVSKTARQKAAHTIKDSALEIGAWQIARTAEDAEWLEADAYSERQGRIIQDLEQRIDEANCYIGSLLADA
jgi:hypothetical protein